MNAIVIRMDVWAGEDSMDHIARSHHPVFGSEWVEQARAEMSRGNLVNLRGLADGEGWGPSEDFDLRSDTAKGGHA